MIGIIGGTGVYDILNDAKIIETFEIDTPYGKSPEISLFELNNKKLAFIARHSKNHDFPPHKINYRANIWALNSIGVNKVLATNAVGSVKEEIPPGSIVIPDDFIDFTKLRPNTFYDDEICHIDMTEPYCPSIRKILRKNKNIVDGGVYLCSEGPRFETKAEVKMFERLGATVLGMTGLPELVLAREMEMCYVSICTVSNYSTSIADEKLTMDEVLEIMNEQKTEVVSLIKNTIAEIDENEECICQKILEGSGKK